MRETLFGLKKNNNKKHKICTCSNIQVSIHFTMYTKYIYTGRNKTKKKKLQFYKSPT